MATALKRALTEDTFAETMGLVVAAINKETDAKIAALQTQIKRLEAGMELKFGQWQPGQYKAGSIVSIPALGIYRAVDDTAAHPSKSASWQLLLKAGRDGRDGRDAVEPPAQRTARSSR